MRTGFLHGLLGTQVTVDLWPHPITGPASETWEITEKIDEEICPTDENDSNNGKLPAYVLGTFRCRSTDDNDEGKKLGIVKIYKQIPYDGTQFYDYEYRKQQAVEPYEPRELIALKALKHRGCVVVPELLGYRLTKQDAMEIVPRGCLMYIVWKQVPGEPLTEEAFWQAPLAKRDEIRAQFRHTYQQLVEYAPLISEIRKIIYDWTTGEMHISGFWRAASLDGYAKWDDYLFVQFDLVSANPSYKHYFTIGATDTYHDEKGWRCSAYEESPDRLNGL
ncbi:uncharacterized protein N7515_009093 [Penicillium bovifimosum]|uniref:Uncharacterized protein n=1 Tax=Penicillium bovifimosum TaxID=126998 RepID=A0A9W9KV65_9EURO|nr:uncharacterized protein N7515_009093 [Penicillium bovifimosum]KAJ5121132.1 hypothetical protein N7515_009093 [Penicillium bovifimosum]